MNITRAVLPVTRKQGSGHILTITTSTAGIVGGETASAYAAAKFGAEGWMEALAPEVAPFGIKTTLVEPGFFRTELLEPASTTWAELSLDDRPSSVQRSFSSSTRTTPVRWVAGTDAVTAVEQKARDLLAQIDAYRELSTSLAID